jgi:hypothetical protein
MNYVVLGRVIEVVSGESWSSYIAAHIFAPLGMTHSATSKYAVDPRALARPYWPEFGVLAIEPLQVGDFMAPASNILTTAPDLARFAAAHLGALGTGAPILAPASLDEAHLGGASNGNGGRYALGWVNERFLGFTVFHHGGAAGHSTAVYLVPERQLAVVVLLGAYGHIENERIVRGVLSLALGARPEPADGLSELSRLTWTSRIFVGLTLACPVTLGILPLVRRRRWPRWATRRYRALRALILCTAAGTLWFLALWLLPHKVPELPLPFGFHGWLADLALGVGTVLFTATGWALWGLLVLVWSLRVSQPQAYSAPAQ